MPVRHQQHRGEKQYELEREAAAPAEQAHQPRDLRDQRMAAVEHRLVQRKIADPEDKDEQYYHLVTFRETFVGRGLPLVGLGAAFVAALVARRPLNDFIEPCAQVVLNTPIPFPAPRPSAVPKLRRNPKFVEEDDMRMQSLALALGAAVLAAPVAARDEAPTVGVHYGDLDLTSEAGQRQLDLRLERAARDVCGVDEKMTGSHLRADHSRVCYREARRTLDQQYAQLVSRKLAAGG